MAKPPVPKHSPKMLLEYFSYNPETGIILRKTNRYGGNQLSGCKCQFHAGSVAGSLQSKGYLITAFDGTKYLNHRLAWALHYSVWPTGQIDHLDGCKSNNSIKNLRDVSHSVNQQNRRVASGVSKTGFLGVVIRWNKFEARITVNHKVLHLGSFKTPEEAHEAYLTAKRIHHEGCTI